MATAKIFTLQLAAAVGGFMRSDMGKRGVIYILSNPAYPGILKIGRTKRDVQERVRELSRPTGVPEPFEVIWDAVVSNAEAAEREIHSALSDVRVNRSREFFRVKVRDALSLVQAAANRYPVNEESESEEIEILPALDRRMRRWLRSDLVSIKFAQYPDLCLLKIIRQPDVSSPVALETVFDLRVLGDYDDDSDGLLYSSFRRTIQENVELFLELDVYSMLMVGIDIIEKEAGNYVAAFWEKSKIDPPHRPRWTVAKTVYDIWASEDEEIIEKIHNYESSLELSESEGRLF